MKLQEHLRAVKLRKQGKSYKDIVGQLGVSKGTLSAWLRDIELTSRQVAALKGRQRSQYAGSRANHQKKLERIKKTTAAAYKEARQLYRTSPLFMVGLMLYWAEGDKSTKIERVKFVNSDPEMIGLMMRWFREVCKVTEDRFRICVHIHTLHSRPAVEKYWANTTGVPLSQFHKTYIKPTSLKHRRNPLYDGTCSIVISDKELFRKIQGWKLGALEVIKN